jgi:acyl carrier protein
MERREVIDIICQVVREVPGAPENVDENTRLFGSEGFLDSLKLVNVVLDTEQQINDSYNLAISLADDRSVSQKRSPFRSVASLADYILTVAAEQTQA